MDTLIQETLKPNITSEATYDKQKEKEECHPKTRRRLLGQIDEWMTDPSNSEQRCWWITGLAAMGKSTVAITIAKSLEDDGQPLRPPEKGRSGAVPNDADSSTRSLAITPPLVLGAQYFINHKLESSNPDNIFPTIASRFSRLFIATRVCLQDTIKHLEQKDATHKLLKLSDYQADMLFVKPLQELSKATQFKRHIIVVIFDGIDELQPDLNLVSSKRPLDPLSLFTTILCTAAEKLPSNVKVLVLSRPEQTIVQTLGGFGSHIHVSTFPTEDMLDDVDLFLEDGKEALAASANRQDWPSIAQIDIIRAVSQEYIAIAKAAFLWVYTMQKKYGIGAGNAAFNTIEKVKKGDIYHFYQTLLREVIPETYPEELKPGCTFVLACLVITQAQTIGTMQQLHQIQNPDSQFDVYHFITQIRSIINEGTSHIDDDTIPSPHKSLVDYLTSDQTTPPFHIDVGYWQGQFAELSFKIMQDPKFLHFNMGNITTSNTSVGFDEFKNSDMWADRQTDLFKYQIGEPKPVNHLVEYVCDTLHVRLSESTLSKVRILEIVDVVMKKLFTFWIEVIALMKYHQDAEFEDIFHPMLPIFRELVKVHFIFYISD